MSLLIKGISRLSQLEIDADKDWAVQGISNIKEVVLGMTKGDLAVKGNTVLQRLQPGALSMVLTSAGYLKIPVWMPGAALEAWIPALVEITHAEALVTVDQSHNENPPLTSEHEQAYLDAPADYIKRLTPAILCPDAEAIVPADQTHNENSPVASEGGVQLLVDGAVADDGGVQTDETVPAREATPDDMILLPPCTNGGLVVGDAYYFGFTRIWDRLWLNVTTVGVGNYALAHEYWNGVGWAGLPGIVDDTSEFTIAGLNKMDWTRPGDWAQCVVQAMNLYWIRARVVAAVTYTQQPKGGQAWCEVLA